MPIPADKIINSNSQPRRPLVQAHKNFSMPSLGDGSGIGVSGKAGRRVSKKRNRAFIGSDKASIAVRQDKYDNVLS